MDLIPSQQDALTWFRKSQIQAVIKDGIVPQWFHGIISRKAAEEQLMPKPPGYFLIRVSETRIGYTLSYRDENRCKHFMIDAVKDGYVIVGDDKHHRRLQDLVDYHSRTPIFPFSELLTVPCGQKSDINDYDELLFPVRKQNPTPSLPQNNSMQPKKSDPVPQEEIPPALPYRPNDLMNSAVPSPNIQSTRLYPSLDDNIIINNISMGPDVPVPPHRKRYSLNQITPSQPPELPSRTLVTSQNQPAIRTIYGLLNPPTDNLHHAPNAQSVSSQDAKTSVVTNLKKFKKHFLKTRTASQESVYEEIKVENMQEGDSPKSSDNYHNCQKMTDQKTIHGDPLSHNCSAVSVTLPQEYLPPPPFAPGFI